MGFSRQEYWSGLPFPSPGDPNPGIEPRSPALQADSLLIELPGKIDTLREKKKPIQIVDLSRNISCQCVLQNKVNSGKIRRLELPRTSILYLDV